MSPQKGASRPDECSIDMPFTCQEEISICKIPKAFTDRCPSQSSSLNSNSGDICRICHCEGGPDLPLITPCYCSGSLRYVHQTCLQQWIKSSNIRCCELCKFQFIMQTKVKPFNEWEYLEMSGLERKKLLCAMLFHIIAMTCVCWSLYVLIDRTLDEVRKGHLEWPFWTKLIVVGIGFMGGIVFMYIQCRAYFVLCKRWKAYNRVIYVQDAPEKSSPQSTKLLTNPSDREGVPSCSFKSYSDSCRREVVPETNCIDIKGVRNLHIIFGEENRIRFHHDGVHDKRALMQGEHCEDAALVLRRMPKYIFPVLVVKSLVFIGVDCRLSKFGEVLMFRKDVIITSPKISSIGPMRAEIWNGHCSGQWDPVSMMSSTYFCTFQFPYPYFGVLLPIPSTLLVVSVA